MAKQWQIRRGTTAENNEFTGAIGEITMDTEKKQLRIHDGETLGGFSIDPLVAFQIPTEENGYTWYRRYASGWVEQGGFRNNYGGTITFPVTMKLANQYTAIAVHNGNTAKGEGFINCYNKTTTGMSYGVSSSTSGMAWVSWFVSGIAA